MTIALFARCERNEEDIQVTGKCRLGREMSRHSHSVSTMMWIAQQSASLAMVKVTEDSNDLALHCPFALPLFLCDIKRLHCRISWLEPHLVLLYKNSF
jgi:hypothetical protein